MSDEAGLLETVLTIKGYAAERLQARGINDHRDTTMNGSHVFAAAASVTMKTELTSLEAAGVLRRVARNRIVRLGVVQDRRDHLGEASGRNRARHLCR